MCGAHNAHSRHNGRVCEGEGREGARLLESELGLIHIRLHRHIGALVQTPWQPTMSHLAIGDDISLL